MSASQRPFDPRDSVDGFARDLAGIAVRKTDKLAKESLTFEDTVMERFDQLDEKLTDVDDRLTKVDSGLKGVGSRLTEMDTRLTGVGSRLTGVERLVKWLTVAIACSLILGLATFIILVAFHLG